MHGMTNREQLLPPSLPEGFGFFRALWWCIAFDAALALIYLAWRALPWLH